LRKTTSREPGLKSGKILTDHSEIETILSDAKTIAVVGLSPKPHRDSNMVGRYLKEKGYKVIPVRPAQKEILGEKAYASLDDIEERVDIINVFINSARILPQARMAIRLKPKVFWMQLNIENREAADLLVGEGIDVVMNSCIKVEHELLIRKVFL
jgi:predicted CoA-binding protein